MPKTYETGQAFYNVVKGNDLHIVSVLKRMGGGTKPFRYLIGLQAPGDLVGICH